MTAEPLKKALEAFEEAGREGENKASLLIDKSEVVESCRKLKEMGMEHLSSLTAVDTKRNLKVVYHLANYEDSSIFKLYTQLSYENPVLPSVTEVWDYARWYERETREMFGIRFEDHPDQKKLLLTDEIGETPLRKEFPLEGENKDES